MVIENLYKQWCKETKRSGGILVGGSINEFFRWVDVQGYKLTLDYSKVLILRTDEEVRNAQVNGYTYLVP